MSSLIPIIAELVRAGFAVHDAYTRGADGDLDVWIDSLLRAAGNAMREIERLEADGQITPEEAAQVRAETERVVSGWRDLAPEKKTISPDPH